MDRSDGMLLSRERSDRPPQPTPSVQGLWQVTEIVVTGWPPRPKVSSALPVFSQAAIQPHDGNREGGRNAIMPALNSEINRR